MSAYAECMKKYEEKHVDLNSVFSNKYQNISLFVSGAQSNIPRPYLSNERPCDGNQGHIEFFECTTRGRFVGYLGS
jgi:hypothetical protein